MKFSVITCTWNSEPYLAESIASVLSQDYPDIEYIFVDGGSTDGTLERIRAIPREVKLVTDVRGGISRAMNEGVRAASGDVVSHLHSDDYYLYPRVLSDVAEIMSRTGAQWVFGRDMTDLDGKLVAENYAIPKYSYKELLRLNFVPHPSTFIRRDLFKRVGGFDESLKFSMDYDFFLRIGKVAEPVQVDKHFTAFRAHSGSASTANALGGFNEDFRVRLRHAGWFPWALLYHGAYYVGRRLRWARQLAGEKH
jgi:glycosyltransferase involved in cell wall biosynthesis